MLFRQTILLLLLLSPTEARAQEVRLLSVDSPSSYFKDPQTGQISGISYEILTELAQRLAIKAQVESLPWKRIEKLAATEKNLIFGPVARTPGREKLYTWLGETHQESFHFFTFKTSKIPLAKAEIFKNRKTCRSFGNVTDEMAEKLGLSKVETVHQAIICARQLKSGRVDAWFGGRNGVRFNYRLAGYDLDEIDEGPALFKYPIHIAASPDLREAEVGKWRKAMEELRKDGTIARILKKYYP